MVMFVLFDCPIYQIVHWQEILDKETRMEREMHICSYLDLPEQMWKVKKRAIKIVFFLLTTY